MTLTSTTALSASRRNGNERYSTLIRAPEIKSNHQIHFNVSPSTFFLGRVLLLCRGYRLCILIPANRVAFHMRIKLKSTNVVVIFVLGNYSSL